MPTRSSGRPRSWRRRPAIWTAACCATSASTTARADAAGLHPAGPAPHQLTARHEDGPGNTPGPSLRLTTGERISRPQERKSDVKGTSVSVRVDLGCRRIIKKKQTTQAIKKYAY